MKRLLLLSTCLLAATSAFAQNVMNQSPAYQECSALASTDPAQALAKADDWLKIDTSIAAQHCRAMALYGLRRFSEAGDGLAAVRNSIARENIGMRSYLARQTAKAWANANRTDQAFGLLSSQLDEVGTVQIDNATAAKITADLLLDRARLNATYGKLDDAARDLDHAVSLTPINEDVLMERAITFRKLGDTSLARADAETVLKINGQNGQAKDLLVSLGAMPMPAPNLIAPAASAPSVVTPKRTVQPTVKK